MPITNPIRPSGKPPTAVLSNTPIYEDEPRMMRGDMTRPWRHFFAELTGWTKKTETDITTITAQLGVSDIGKIIAISRTWYLR